MKNSTLFKILLVCGGITLNTLASAHVHPQTQTPGANAEVSAPAAVKIEFDGPLEPAFSTLSVSDAQGHIVSTGHAQVDSTDRKLISVALPSLPSGKYTVHWTAVAADSHRTQGDYSFSIK